MVRIAVAGRRWAPGLRLAAVLAVLLVLASLFSALFYQPAAQPALATATVALAQLPQQGRETYRLIHQGGPFPYEKDGTVFGNREGLLPQYARGYYREYTVATPKARNRGARRIVCAGPAKTPVQCYYSADHYASFRTIVE